MRSRRMYRFILASAAGLAVVLAGQTAGHAATVSATGSAATAPSTGFNNWNCRPSAAHPQPVVLLHGLGATGPENFAELGPYLASAGFCAYAPTYGEAIPGVPVGGLTAIPQSATQIAAFIGQVRASTGAAKVDLVGHSEGAFEALYGPKFVPGEAGEVERVVALAPPTHGTTFASLVTIAGDLGALAAVDAVLAVAGCAACTELITGSSLIASLNSGAVAQPGIAYTIIASTHDELVTPYGTEFVVNEPSVVNETVQTTCPLDPVGHIGLAFDSDVAELVVNALDPASPVRVTCTVGPAF
jgi:triacylglycerol esterase/lipase EstA (alpha/beta hydrolase family)